jgi:hypothetical protein
MQIAILGCGPAGLLAAHAAIGMGEDVVIFSNKGKSHLNGAQYLHAAIPGTPSEDEEPVTVSYQLFGSGDDYRTKVYGKDWDGTVSPEDLSENHPAWDIRATYDFLWDQYEGSVNDSQISAASLLGRSAAEYDMIISSIPAPILCVKGHTFASTEIWAAGDAHGMLEPIPYECPDNTVLCNGEKEPAWYRISNLYGHKTVEWPGTTPKPPVRAVRVTKPTFNNCDCLPNIKRVGRYGRWEKGVLSHDAFQSTLRALM